MPRALRWYDIPSKRLYNFIGNGGDRGGRRDEHLRQVILPRISCHEGFGVGRAWRVFIGWSCISTMKYLIMHTQWRSEWVNVGAAAYSLESLFGFRGIVKWGILGVSVGDISEWWLWGCGAAAGRLMVWVQEGSWSTMCSRCSRRSWGQEAGNIRPVCSTRMSIGGGVWICDFLSCTFGQLWWVLCDSFLCPLFLLIHPVSRDSVWNFGFCFLTRKSVGALVPPQLEGSSIELGRSPGHQRMG